MQIKTANTAFQEFERGFRFERVGDDIFMHLLNNNNLMYPMITVKMSVNEFGVLSKLVNEYENGF